MSNHRLRIAVVQISCHAAARIGDKDYLSEPFVGFRQKSPLMELAKVGLPVAGQRQKFRKAYLEWSRKRLGAILEKLKLGFIFHPGDLRIPGNEHRDQLVRPDIVVFPEYSIPFDHLDLIRDFARETGVTVFAGTHSLESDLTKYGSIPEPDPRSKGTRSDKSTDHGKFNFFDFSRPKSSTRDKKVVDEDCEYGYTRIENYANGSIATKSVMPVFNVYVGRDRDKAKDILIPKRMLSIFEMTASRTSKDSTQFRDSTQIAETADATADERRVLKPFLTVSVRPLKDPFWKERKENIGDVRYEFERDVRFEKDKPLWSADSKNRVAESDAIRVLPLICSEALQFSIAHPDLEPDLAIFLAYNDKDEPFDPEIQRHSKNKIPVVFCNDGKCGGSSVTIPFDERIDFWWTDIPNRGRLPEGDSVLVTDVDLKNVAVPVNINKVEDRIQVLALSAVVPENDSLSEYRVAMRLADLRARTTQSTGHGKGRAGHSQKPVVPLTPEYALRVLEECRDAESPTPLQLRKVVRLCDLKDVDERLWQIHGQDIIFDETSDQSPGRNSPTPPGQPSAATGKRPRQQREENPRRTARQLSNLNGLERRQARECIDFIRSLAKSERLNADQSAVLHQALSYCRTVAECAARESEPKSAEHVERAVWRFFDSIRERAVRKAVRQVTTVVADLVARFGASSAWLFRTDSLKDNMRGASAVQDSHSATRWLRLVITHNARFEPERLPYGDANHEQSLVGYVAEIGRGALYREIVHSYRHTIPRNFRPVKGRYTGSAIAVPIFARDGTSADNELLGVLTLESNRTAAFTPHHLAELESEATRLVHSLIVLRKASETVRDYRLIWNPEASSWNLTDVLNEFCFNLASSVPDPRQDPGFGCTVWYADHVKYKAFAQGAVRFDHEYLTSMLPTVDGTKWPKVKPQSFVGYVTSRVGMPEWVWRGEWDAAPYFVRKDKAAQMGLRTIVAAPIYKLEDLDKKERAAPVPNAKAAQGEQFAGWPQGALCFYFYDDDSASRDTAYELIDNLAVLRCCDILSRFLTRSRKLGAEMAAGLTRSRLRTEVTRLEVGFDVLRDIVMECLDGDGCSVFLCDDTVLQPPGWPKRLHCVSTTGIRPGVGDSPATRASRDGRNDLPPSVLYNVPASEQKLRTSVNKREKFMGERTLRCLLPDKSPVRDNLTNVGPAPNEQTSPARHIETGLLDAFEDRRFLGVGVFCASERGGRIPLGIIRVLRSAHSRPFVEADGEMLQAIASSATPLFLEALHQFEQFVGEAQAAARQGGADGEKHATPPTGAESAQGVKMDWLYRLRRCEGLSIFEGLSIEKHAQLTAAEGLRRVCSIPEYNDGWTRRRVVAVLRDLLVGLRPYGTRSAFVSIVTENDTGSDQMNACYFESLGQDHPALPPHAEPVHEADDAIRWRAHNDRNLIQFDQDLPPDLFTPLTAGQGDTAAGFCLPLQLGFHGRPVDAVLAVDFTDRLKSLSQKAPDVVNDIVYCINQAAAKLVALSAGVTGAAVARVNGFTAAVSMKWLDECLSSPTPGSVSLGTRFTFVDSALCPDASRYHRYFQLVHDDPESGSRTLNVDWDIGRDAWKNPKGKPKRPRPPDPATWCYDFSERMQDNSRSLDALYSRMVDRNPKNFVANPEIEAPVRRAFGRSPHECADNIRLLKQLDVKLDFEEDRFALPLRFGFYIIGYCVGEFDLDAVIQTARKRMLPIDKKSDLLTNPKGLLVQRECVNIMAESIFALNEAWLLRAYSISYNKTLAADYGSLFGITFAYVPHEGDRSAPLKWPTIDERRDAPHAAKTGEGKRETILPK